MQYFLGWQSYLTLYRWPSATWCGAVGGMETPIGRSGQLHRNGVYRKTIAGFGFKGFHLIGAIILVTGFSHRWPFEAGWECCSYTLQEVVSGLHVCPKIFRRIHLRSHSGFRFSWGKILKCFLLLLHRFKVYFILWTHVMVFHMFMIF